MPTATEAPASIVSAPNNFPLYGVENSVAFVIPESTFSGALNAEPLLKFNVHFPVSEQAPKLLPCFR